MLALFILAHLVADFVLQPYWLVQRKRRWDGLLLHGALVLICMLLLPLFEPSLLRLWPLMLAITAVHVAADHFKVRYGHTIPGPPIVPFMLDQLIHVTTLIIALSLELPANQVWSLAASPAAPLALYCSVYITAALAAPIATIVWLDPTFSHAPLAGAARVRCLCAAVAVISLTLLAGVVALPATLLGLAFTTRHPASAHPLDLPSGQLAVLVVAATSAAALALLAW